MIFFNFSETRTCSSAHFPANIFDNDFPVSWPPPSLSPPVFSVYCTSSVMQIASGKQPVQICALGRRAPTWNLGRYMFAAWTAWEKAWTPPNTHRLWLPGQEPTFLPMCKPFRRPLVTSTRIVPGSRLGPDLPSPFLANISYTVFPVSWPPLAPLLRYLQYTSVDPIYIRFDVAFVLALAAASQFCFGELKHGPARNISAQWSSYLPYRYPYVFIYIDR